MLSLAQAKFEFKNSLHKFPKAKEGDQLQHYYVFKNTGTAPLVITDYKVACVCTRVLFPLKPVMPGAIDSIRVNFDSEAKAGHHLRVILLRSNASNDPVEIRFKVFVAKRQ